MRKLMQINIKLSEKEKEMLIKLAKRFGMGISAWVRMMIYREGEK